jgi:hypothetical protein
MGVSVQSFTQLDGRDDFYVLLLGVGVDFAMDPTASETETPVMIRQAFEEESTFGSGRDM